VAVDAEFVVALMLACKLIFCHYILILNSQDVYMHRVPSSLRFALLLEDSTLPNATRFDHRDRVNERNRM
jgi:hypothetical protein